MNRVSILFSLIITSIIAILFCLIILFTKSVFFENSNNLIFLIFSLFFLFFIIMISTNILIGKFVKSKIDDLYSAFNSSGIPIETDEVKSDSKKLVKSIQQFADDSNIKIKLMEQKENFRREFIGNLAHELKTPLFTVQGYVYTILDGLIDSKKEIKSYLKKSLKGINRLEEIINDLDTITKIESGSARLKITSFDLNELITDVFDMLEPKSKKKQISLTLENSGTVNLVNGDIKSIRQVLTNLVDNSLKYGIKGGTTEILINNISDDKVLVRVIDNGKGITENHLPRVFERFYRVDENRSRSEGGSGLGLAIVKHIIEAHNEQIYVESTEGIGSEFAFTLKKSI